jgi:ABC-type polar amino acid transport system ATPase subunit
VTAPLIELASVSKDYRGLRPLRVQELIVSEGESVALVGFDRPAAEVLVNLVTGATLPDAGRIVAFGRSTHEIADSDDWLALVDRFGIVTDRAVLLESLSVLQNLAMPFTLEIEPLGDAARERAASLAREVGLSDARWDDPVRSLDASDNVRVRVARACALDPPVLLLEHASASLAPERAATVGAEIRAVAARRGAALIALTADERFARAVATRVLHWDPASGRLAAKRGWFRGRLG